MSTWESQLDRQRRNAYFADRMHRILAACGASGLLWHIENRDAHSGEAATHRVRDIAPSERVEVTPREEKYALRVSPRALAHIRYMATEFAAALGVPATQVEVAGDIAYIRVPRRAEPTDVGPNFEDLWRTRAPLACGTVLLGSDEVARQLVLDLVAPANAHAAVIGAPTSRANLLRAMALSALMARGAQVALLDPAGDLAPLSGHPAVWRGGRFALPDECLQGLHWLAEGLGGPRYGLILAFLSDAAALIASRPEARDLLGLLAQAGPQAGIHLILGARHLPYGEASSLPWNAVPVRLVATAAEQESEPQATAPRASDTEPHGGADGFLAISGGAQRHFVAPRVSHALLADWQRRYPPRQALRPAQLTSTPPAAAPAPWPSTAKAPRASSAGGRPMDDIPDIILTAIARYVATYGRAPSSNWVYRYTKTVLPGGGFNRSKARRAIALAANLPPLADGESTSRPVPTPAGAGSAP